jgi:regulator of protease activity HflC (stomatin/prohibitin superfamily)
MFTTLQIRVHERVLVLRDGRAASLLGPGSHTLFTLFSPVEIVRFDLTVPVTTATPELCRVLTARDGLEHAVADDELALVRVDGVPHRVLGPGRWVLWQARAEVTAENVSTRALDASTVPVGFRALAGNELRVVEVAESSRGLLFVDGRFERVLDPGAHAFFTRDRGVRVELVDLRERELQVVGQEVMTADKVSLRLNLVVKFRVADALRSTQAVTSLHDAVYSEAQVQARRHIASRTIDQLLEQRNDTSEQLRAELSARLADWGLELVRADLKDLVLPGDMRALLNQVIEAEKRAAANVIQRREETAATRSLANTAKLLESNPTLLRLKELEAWKHIAGTVGNVTVVAAPQQLLGALSLGPPRADG